MNIREPRKAARLTQIEVAQRTCISRMRISLAECGYVNLTQDELAAIQTVIAEEPTRRANKIREAFTDGEVLARG